MRTSQLSDLVPCTKLALNYLIERKTSGGLRFRVTFDYVLRPWFKRSKGMVFNCICLNYQSTGNILIN